MTFLALTVSLVVALIAANVATLAGYLYWQSRQKRTPIDQAAIAAAVVDACARVGLSTEHACRPDFDLVATGKLYSVLHHAAAALGRDPELRTVQDVIDWLAEAPARG
jgi:hypothetical protein